MKRGLTSIVIPVRNQLPYTKLCISSIKKFTRSPYECIIVDNGSSDGTAKYCGKIKNCTVISSNKNLGFAPACNMGIRAARGEYIVLLNNDVYVTPRWLENLLNCLKGVDHAGLVGPVTNYATGIQKIKVNYRSLNEMLHFAETFNHPDPGKWIETTRLTGICMLLPAEIIEQVGYLDEDYLIGGYEDDDYCIRIIKAGYKIICAQDTFIHHFGSITFRGENLDIRKIMAANYSRFLKKWGSF